MSDVDVSSQAVERVEVTARLAEFVADASWDDIPARVRHEAKRSLLNHFAVALGGCNDEVVDRVSRVLDRPGTASATVIGRGERRDAWDAAYINAISANVLDFDDTHAPTIIHPTAPVAPPLFAHAETATLSGRDLLLAFIVGVEVECRLGVAVSPGHYRRGWHITSTCGVFGAAAAMSKAIGLDARRVGWALGNASAGSSGLIETLGFMSKSLGVGGSARNGWLASIFAANGVSGPERPLEGARGFLGVMGDNDARDDASIVAGLGDRWALTENTYKPYPCGVVLNPVIEACLAIRATGGFDARDIDSIVVTGNPLLAERADRPDVQFGRESQVSAQHGVAVVFVTGRAGAAEFSDDAVRDPVVRSIYPRVRVVRDASYPIESATVELRLRSHAPVSRTVACARGSLGAPLDDDDLERKLAALALHGGFGDDIRPLADAVWNIDSEADAGRIVALAAGSARRA